MSLVALDLVVLSVGWDCGLGLADPLSPVGGYMALPQVVRWSGFSARLGVFAPLPGAGLSPSLKPPRWR